MTSVDPTAIDIRFDPRERRMRGMTAHKNMHFDVPYITQITDDLWVGGCTNGLVLPEEITNLVNVAPWWSYTVNHELFSTMEVVMYDSLSQGTDQVKALAGWVNVARKTGPTLVHCQAGLNRSNLTVATALILDGGDPKEVIALLREKRSPAVLCNQAFEDWLLSEVLPAE